MSRPNQAQMKKLLDLLSKDGVLVEGKVAYCGSTKQSFWKRIALQLNAVEGGVRKNTWKWCKMWSDWKTKTKQKANMLLQKKEYHNGKKVAPLTSLELRLLRMICYPVDDKMDMLDLEMVNNRDIPEATQDEISDFLPEDLEAPPSPQHNTFLDEDDNTTFECFGHGRVNQIQMKKLLDLLSEDGVLVEGNVSYANTNYQTFWEHIALQLNSVKGGGYKTFGKWCKMWTDWKTKTKKKANILLRKSQQYNNGKKVTPLTSLELRLLKMIDYPVDDKMDVLDVLDLKMNNHSDEISDYHVENVDIAAPIPIHFESTDTYVSTRKRANSYEDKSDDTMGYNFAKQFRQALRSSQDEFDIFAQYVASELRETRDPHSVLVAKDYINDILFNARMGTYRKDTDNNRKSKVKIEYDHNSDINDDENNASEGTVF